MPLAAGTRLGPYEIVGPLGAGGMGEVYRARDTRLDRDAALKILPAAYSLDADRLSRFHREARATAALSHVNIVAVYDVGLFENCPYIISELLDGQTLRAWLAATNPSVSRAAEIGAQIARGLAAAHDRGILHRDLKPDNIFILRDGRAKILDFGLAKLTAPDASITQTELSGTDPGQVLGTAAYMSPEQARGAEVDERTDIFAVGAILYEMFAGRRAFSGNTLADIITAVIKDDPPSLAELGRQVPPLVDRIVRRCLEKEPDARFRTASDLAFALDAVTSLSSPPIPAVVEIPRRRWLEVSAVLAVPILAFAAGWWASRRAPAAPAPAVRFEIQADPAAPWANSNGVPSLAVSPDGQTLAWTIPDGRHPVMVRRIGDERARALEGTSGASNPIFSPEGDWIAFLADGRLKRVPIGGGTSTTICPVREMRGAAWISGDRIVFSSLTDGLNLVPASGGDPAVVLPIDQGSHFVWPAGLPDSDSILVTKRAAFGLETGSIVAVNLRTKATREVLSNASDAAFTRGRLFFGRGDGLWSIPFDPVRLAVAGKDEPALAQVERAPGNGETQYAISAGGTIAYVPEVPGRRAVVEIIDRAGQLTSIPSTLEPGGYFDLAVSPDGSRIALAASKTDRFVTARVDGSSVVNLSANRTAGGLAWSADGRRLIYSGGSARPSIWSVGTDGTKPPEQIIAPTDYAQVLHDIANDGSILYREQSLDQWRLLFKPASGGAVRTIPVQPMSSSARLDPRDEWIVYATGARDVILLPVNEDVARPVRLAAGLAPFWSPDGGRVFFLQERVNGDRSLAAVTLASRTPPRFTPPVTIAACPACLEAEALPDGRFVVLRSVAQQALPATINVIVNWQAGPNLSWLR